MTTNKKNIIIIGSEGNLGSAIVQKLLKNDLVKVVAIDKNDKSQFPAIDYFQANFSKSDQVELALNYILDHVENESILISTIGKFGNDYQMQDLDFTSMLETIQVNLLGISKICLDLSKYCIKNNYKIRFVLVGSTASYVGSRDIGYAISKSGINGLVVSLSKCFSEKGVVAIGVNPGIFQSSMSESVASERQKFTIEQTHIKRSGYINEIATVVLYAALNAPDFSTGSLIDVNGGQYS